MSAASSAVIPAGFDLSRTAYAYKLFDLDPIPANAFGPGSDPFTDRIDWTSGSLVEFNGHPLPVGSVDTVVVRPEDAVLNGPGSSTTIPVQMEALSFAGIKPIDVTYGGAQSEQWNVDAVAPKNPAGTMTISQTSPDGGTFDSEFNVHPVFTFTRLSDGFQIVVDVVAAGLPPNIIRQEAVPWTFESAAATLIAESSILRVPELTSNFVPGFTTAEGRMLMEGQAFSPDNPVGLARGAHGHFTSVELPPMGDEGWVVIPPSRGD